MNNILVFDASPLIALQELGLMDKLVSCIDSAGWYFVITTQVYDEVVEPPELRIFIDEKITNKKITMIKISTNDLYPIYPSLGLGESSIIAASKILKSSYKEIRCVIDDKQARIIAFNSNCRLTGTIGIIKQLKKRGFIGEEDIKKVKNHLSSVIYCSQALLQEL